MTTTYSQSNTLFKDIAALLTGQLFLPDDTAYEQVRQLWNGRVKTQPAAIARYLTVQDVIHTIRWTREHGLPLPSPFSTIIIHNFHGTASRVSVSETAFALRQDHLMVELIAAWEPQSKDEDRRHIQWAQNLSQALAPFALKGGYISLLDEQEQERVPLAYGSNYERLLDLKRKYDPEDVFRSTIGHLASKEKS